MGKRISLRRYEKKFNYGFIAIIAIVLIIMIVRNAVLIYSVTASQTENLGKRQLESISRDMQIAVEDAVDRTTRVAMETEFRMERGNSYEELAAFFSEEKAEQKAQSDGTCINVYSACEEWMIIPDFSMPENFSIQDRLWYTGAFENGTEDLYITSPYLDAATNNMCFTVSTLLKDGKTVVALDFNLSKIQKSIQEMCSDGNGDALIVNSNGLIIGYTDTSCVGVSLSTQLPEYESIFQKVKSENEKNQSFKTSIDGRRNTIFSSKTENDWYLILSVNDWALYRDSYHQMIRNSLLNLICVLVIVLFYINGYHNRIRAEKALAVKEEFLSGLSGEFREPLNRILKYSNYEVFSQSENKKENISRIQEAGLLLSSMMDNLFSYSGIVAIDKEQNQNVSRTDLTSRKSRQIQAGILAVLLFAMTLTIILGTTIPKKWGAVRMEKEALSYSSELRDWMTEQKSILDMFVNLIAANPEMLEQYEDAVTMLNDITMKYSEISVTYMTNPNAEHTVIMNNGWVPPDGWRVEERQWYIDTEKSADGFNISAPYYDEQTGLYCVTFSERVYDRQGKFLGIFGIDFYLDKLTEIMQKSYEPDGYAFLVDSNGTVINHPNKEYQLSGENSVNIKDLSYSKVEDNGEFIILKDYDGKWRLCISEHEASSDFRIFVAKDRLSISGGVILLCLFMLILFGACIIAVIYMMRKLVKWQREINERLTKAKDSAIVAGKAKSQFLAQMSHEIRTPINAVLGMNEMILREADDEDITEYAQNIRSAGNTLLTLINSILDFSKIEDGKMEIIPVRYDTGSLINDLVNMISDKAEKKGLLFRLEIDETLPGILYGDDVRISQVITNLLTNAVKYTPEGSVTLRIRGMERDNAANEILLRVEVIDTGIGIRKEDMGKLFTSFQRLDEVKNRNIEGTGLGISIVQKLLLMMGSRLDVSSVYGEGSDFSFDLRQKVIDAEPIGDYDVRRQRSLEEKKNQTYLYAPDACILIVDDNQMNLKVAAGLLKRSAMKIDTALSGRECLQMIQNTKYDMIFLDHMMPEMDGVETLKELKKNPGQNKDTVIAAMTANAIVGAREEYLEAGFDDYISKPIVIAELEKMLKRYLPPEVISMKHMEKEKKEEKQESADEFSQEELLLLHQTLPELDILTGLAYCMGSRSFYLEMLKEYCRSSKAEELEQFRQRKDVENYRILVHALKSTSLGIGAAALSEQAKELELAAKSGEFDTIEEKHPELMRVYQEFLHKLMEYLKREEEK